MLSANGWEGTVYRTNNVNLTLTGLRSRLDQCDQWAFSGASEVIVATLFEDSPEFFGFFHNIELG